MSGFYEKYPLTNKETSLESISHWIGKKEAIEVAQHRIKELEAKNKQQEKLLIEACKEMKYIEDLEGTFYGSFIVFRDNPLIKELLERNENKIN